MASVDAGLRELKKQQTREALHRAAIRLYIAHDPDSVTVNDICTAAGVSRRTFFNYFDSKDDAVLDRDEERSVGSLADRIAERPAKEDPLEAVHQTVREGIAHMLDHPTWRERQQLARQHPRLLPTALANNRKVLAAMAEGVARRTGLPPGDLYPRALASAADGVTRAALTQWDPDDPGTDLIALLDDAFALLAIGFPTTGFGA